MRVLILGVLTLSISAHSQVINSGASNTTYEQSTVGSQTPFPSNNNELIAAQFELTTQEWEKFLLIKKGPLGYKNPDVEPLLALAMYAENNSDRDRYLRTFAKQQRFVWNKGKEIQKAFNAVYKEMYPDELPINPDLIYTDPEMVHPRDRFILVVRKGCESCNESAQHFINSSRIFPRNGLDIYLQGARSEQDVIEWAKKFVPESELQKRDITINMGSIHLDSVLDGEDVNAAIFRNGELTRTVSLLKLLPKHSK